jgi:TonB family protein
MHGHPDVSFTLAVMPQLLDKLAECTADLRHFWNMTDAEQKNIAAPAVGDVRTVFSSSDYPDEALSREQQGDAQFLLLIDEKGKVAKCDVVKPSGIPALDGMACQVIRERAEFKPAVDHLGKPIRSSYVTPPISWRTY